MKAQWLLVVLAANAGAQSLETFLGAADRSNLDTRSSAQSRERAEAEFGQAWGALLPSLTANGGWTHNQYDAVITIPTGATTSTTATIIPKDQFDATFKVEVPLIDATKWVRTSASSSAAEAARQRDVSTRDTVHRQVISAFYSYLGARSLLESAQRSLALAQAQVEVTKARTTAGVANELELMRSNAEVERNQQLVADAEAMVAIGARSLETLSGLTPGEVPLLPTDDLHPAPVLEELQGGVGSLATVRAAEADATAASRTSTAATLALVPTINAQFTERLTNATGFQNANALYNAGVTFNWRLDVPAVQALRAQHAIEASTLIAAERTRRQAADQLHADWHKLKAALKKVQAAGAQVTAARRASSLTHERSAAGVASQLDVIQSERDLFAAEVADIQARAELASARGLLTLSAGLPLEEKR
jgi:outer membrane protein TolC